MIAVRPVEFVGSSLDDLRAFPPSARHEAGYQLDRVQHGLEPDDWKPVKIIGPGVQEKTSRQDLHTAEVRYRELLRGLR